MTDARLPERYLMDRRIVRLSDSERNSYIMSTLWSVSNRTDGQFEPADLPLIPTFNPAAIPALLKCGLWIENGDGWVDAEFKIVQTSRDDLAVLDNIRAADRAKKARAAAHKKGNHELCTPDTCEQLTSGVSFPPGDVPGEVSRGGHRIGKVRQGQADYEADTPQGEQVNSATGEVTSPPAGWAVAVPGRPGEWAGGSTPNPARSNQCRVCDQEANQLDAWGLCSKTSQPHLAARRATAA